MASNRISALTGGVDANRDETSDLSLRSAIWQGLKGGFIATVVMTIYRIPVFRALPPTAEFWARYFGGEAEQYTILGIVLHFLYGSVAGAVFGACFSGIRLESTLIREWAGIVTGSIYGVVLSVFGTEVLFRYVLDRELESDHELVFHVGHLVYGLTLGTWMSSREGVGEVYEDAREA